MAEQTLKLLYGKNLWNPCYIAYAIGTVMSLSTALVYLGLNPLKLEMRHTEIVHTFFEPQCRDARYDNGSSRFEPLCKHLRFDVPSERFDLSPQYMLPDVVAERKDWHDYEAMANDANRTGPGEQGKATYNLDETKKELENKLYLENNFNGFLSDIISVNRSVPDIRPKECLTIRYLAKLPTVSIVIACRNEYQSVLKRTLHSIYNRTPRELLKEVIIVDDKSSRGYSLSDMIRYTDHNFPGLVKFMRLPKRMGLMYVRSAGAKVATGDVIVFFDSHIECNYNWLPPLLEPIAINDQICTTPFIDHIDEPTLRYEKAGDLRGGFYWDLIYAMKYLPDSPNFDTLKPFKDAVMMGGLFAISRRFFWELGGYDVNLDTYGSEQFELSFKIWMCGGLLLSVPCSHVGHIFVVPFDNKKSPKDALFTERNKKRVAEVWMDDYKHYVYSTKPETFYKLNPGDLTEQHAIRERLKCKSFKWYLEFVAPDFKDEHPFDLPMDFANGTIQSLAFTNKCLDIIDYFRKSQSLGAYPCAENRKNPHLNQFWNFNFYQEIKNFYRPLCLDAYLKPPDASITVFYCHREGGNQFWYYDRKRKWLIHGENGTNCMEIQFYKEKFRIVLNECNETKKEMQWVFGSLNEMLRPQRFIKKMIN